MTILPRQARDKRKENSKRDACSYSQLKIPLCPEVGVSIPQQPRFATVLAPECTKKDHFAKTGSGQTQGKLKKRCVVL